MPKKKIIPLLGQILPKIAPKIGAQVIVEPEWNIVGQIIFKNKQKRYFRYSSLDLNTLGASEIAKDKGYANFFIKKLGYPTIPGKTFYSEKWGKAIGAPKQNIDAGYKFAKKMGFPVIVKPNSQSQGIGVSLVHNRKEFYRAMKFIFKQDRVAIVEEQVKGKDYRIVVLDNEIISAYERVPLNVWGDGVSTIKKLLQEKQKQFIETNRDTQIKSKDPRIAEKLLHLGLNLNSVPYFREQIFLLDNANLSTGGDSIDMTKKIHPSFRKIAINLTRDMGLRICGVDLMIEGNISEKAKKYHVLEINATPGLDHYVKNGAEQEKIVDDLYLKVLKSMQKKII